MRRWAKLCLECGGVIDRPDEEMEFRFWLWQHRAHMLCGCWVQDAKAVNRALEEFRTRRGK